MVEYHLSTSQTRLFANTIKNDVKQYIASNKDEFERFLKNESNNKKPSMRN